jgi:molybdopterin-binding protein
MQYITNTHLLGLAPVGAKGETIMALIAVNVRNQLHGKIKAIISGDVVSEVETSSGIISTVIINPVITTRSIKGLGHAIGSEVLALVKATDVSIARL